MAASKKDIEGWLREAKGRGATHLIVVCDRYDNEDYSDECFGEADCREKIEEYSSRQMQEIMEVYDLNLDIEDQLNEHRAFHGP